MSGISENVNALILRDEHDWDNWIDIIWLKALEHDVWQYIDPNEPNPPSLSPPEELDLQDLQDIQSLENPQDRFLFEKRMRDWNESRDIYRAKRAAISRLRTYVWLTLANKHRYLLHVEPDTRTILIKLQSKLKPLWSNLLEDWESLLGGWDGRMKFDDWLDRWSITYSKLRRSYDFTEERALSDFITVMRRSNPDYVGCVNSEHEFKRINRLRRLSMDLGR